MRGVKERVEGRGEEVNTDEQEVKERPEIVRGTRERSHPRHSKSFQLLCIKSERRNFVSAYFS